MGPRRSVPAVSDPSWMVDLRRLLRFVRDEFNQLTDIAVVVLAKGFKC